MNLLTDVTTASKCTIILVNPGEENEYKSIIELKSSVNQGHQRLGLIEDNGSKNTLEQLGIKDGSHIIIVNNINYTIMGTSEK